LKIITLVAEGFSNPEIARYLGLSEITIKKHLSAIYNKLGVANRAEAVAFTLREGIIRR
jgi:DNA-binding NarL/FixJ family response regulator